jgi:hypothetical protein
VIQHGLFERNCRSYGRGKKNGERDEIPVHSEIELLPECRPKSFEFHNLESFLLRSHLGMDYKARTLLSADIPAKTSLPSPAVKGLPRGARKSLVAVACKGCQSRKIRVSTWPLSGLMQV